MPGSPLRRTRRVAKEVAAKAAAEEDLSAEGFAVPNDPLRERISRRAAALRADPRSRERLHLLAQASLVDVLLTGEDDKDRVAAARYLAELTAPKQGEGVDLATMSAEQLEREAAEAERVLREAGSEAPAPKSLPPVSTETEQ